MNKISTLKALMAVLLSLPFFFSCNPVKRIQRQIETQEKVSRYIDSLKKSAADKAVYDYVAAHPLICPEYNCDSCFAILEEIETEKLQNESVIDQKQKEYLKYDSVVPADKKEKIKAPAVTKQVSSKPNIIIRPLTDQRLASLLKDSLETVKRQLADCQGVVKGAKDATATIVPMVLNKKNKWEPNAWTILFFIVTGLWIAKIIIRLKNPDILKSIPWV